MSTELTKTKTRMALDRFEKTALAPVIPGEGEKWCLAVAEGIEEMHPVLKEEIKGHQKLYEEIRHEDPGLSAKVEELKSRDSEALEELVAFLGQSHFAEARVKQTRDNSWEPTSDLGLLRDQILDWVTRNRALQEEIETWYMEAFYRERGEPG